MTQSEMTAATNRLFNIGKDIFTNLSIGDSLYINEEKHQMDGDFTAEPFKVHIKFSIYPENGIITLFSVLPFDVPPTKTSEYAKLICQINYNDFYAGNYDFNPETGKTVFRLALIYRNSVLSREMLEECVKYTISSVSKNNDKLFEAARDN